MASMHDRGAGLACHAVQAQLQILRATGMPASRSNGPRIEVIDPLTAILLLRTAGSDGSIVIDDRARPLTITERAESFSDRASVSANGAPSAGARR